MSKQNYMSKQGNDFILNLTFTNQNGSARDLTGHKILFTAKTDKSLPDTDPGTVSVTGVISNPATLGIATITVPASTTVGMSGTYYYDVKDIDGSGVVNDFQYGVISFQTLVSTRLT